MKNYRRKELKQQVKKRMAENDYLMNNGGYPRLGQMFLHMNNPNASALNDADYLEFVLSQAADAMFPDSDQPPKIGVDTRDSEGDSLLHYASTWGDLRAVRLLVETGADINVLGDMDKTPLHVAVEGRFLDIVEFLLTRGATQDERDAFGYTPLEWAQQMEYADVVAVLQRR